MKFALAYLLLLGTCMGVASPTYFSLLFFSIVPQDAAQCNQIVADILSNTDCSFLFKCNLSPPMVTFETECSTEYPAIARYDATYNLEDEPKVGFVSNDTWVMSSTSDWTFSDLITLANFVNTGYTSNCTYSVDKKAITLSLGYGCTLSKSPFKSNFPIVSFSSM